MSATAFQSKNSCRTCLKTENGMESLFGIFYKGIQFNDIINTLIPIPTILEDDDYSVFICDECREKAIESYDFRELCLNSDVNMRMVCKKEEDEFTAEDYEEHYEDYDNANDEDYIPDSILEQENDGDGDSFCADDLIEKDESFEDIDIPPKKSFDCGECGEKFFSGAKLIKHMNEHKQEEMNEEFEDPENHPEGVVVRSKSNLKYLTRPRNYACSICDKKFESPSKVSRHMSVHIRAGESEGQITKIIEARKYKCPICHTKWTCASKLTRHLKTVHRIKEEEIEKPVPVDEANTSKQNQNETLEDGDNILGEESPSVSAQDSNLPLSCDKCEKTFSSEVQFKRHKVQHSDLIERSVIEGPREFVCVICKETVNDYAKLFSHMRTHRIEYENKDIACLLCTKTFSSIKNIIRHSKMHEENATHQCVVCNRRYGMGEDFLEHLMRHENIKPHTCPVCDKSFLKTYKLRIHMGSHSEAPKPHLCSECGKGFAELEYLNRHIKRHSGIKPHKCQFCPSAFTFKSGLTSHMVTHNGVRSFVCTVCNSAFTKQETLKKHSRIHTGEKPFACEVCGHRFRASGHLARHKRTHTGEKPYQCEYCDRAYAQSNDLVKHLRGHIGDNVYRCKHENCTEAFRLHSELKKHLLTHYQTEMQSKINSEVAPTLS